MTGAQDHSILLGAGVLALTSWRGVDFHKGAEAHDKGVGLTLAQSAWLTAAGVPNAEKIIFPRQVHGDGIWIVTVDDVISRGRQEADALITAEVGLPIAVRTADCLPIFAFDPQHRVVAAIHAGWKSTRLEIASKTIVQMQESFFSDPADLRVYLGPCIRRGSYQVGEEFRAIFPEEVFPGPSGWYLDLAAANIRQLLGVGVCKENIADGGRCTYLEKDKFHSFRRDGESSGRMISLIMLIH